MDPQVIAAMARWPDVPAVYGWLSLTESGHWRLHPDGDALQRPESAGEPITSPQILSFITRNYDADSSGQWFFQNGPQRVYVRVDAAPLILHTTTDAATGRLKLRTHTGLDIRRIDALYVDETGRLYAATDRGPALVVGRDLPSLLEAFKTTDEAEDVSEAIEKCLETGCAVEIRASGLEGFPDTPVVLQRCPLASLEAQLEFRRRPQAA